MRIKNEKGQAILLVVVAMGIFLVGALGLAIDGAQLFGHRGMAQVAADAAAQAAILSIYNGTNVGTNAFAPDSTYIHTCTPLPIDAITPCRFAGKNGFGGTSDDEVKIDVPTAAAAGLDPAVLSASDPVNLIRVTITRHVPAGIIRMLGAANTTDVRAVAVAAIVAEQSAIPMVITHPNLAHALDTNAVGNPTAIVICGGPPQSIEVNSSDPNAYNYGGTIDLSKAGPLDPGDCSTGTGADFGLLGGPATNPGTVSLGTLPGRYISGSHIFQDPLAFVPAPAVPTKIGITFHAVNGADGCRNAGTNPSNSGCDEYTSGLYVGGLNLNGGRPVIFQPGLYYMQGGGFTLRGVDGGGGNPGWNAMCPPLVAGVGCLADPDTGNGMVVYDTGPAGSTTSGGFNIFAGTRVALQGATPTTTNAKGETVPAGPYYGLLFWEDRAADAHTGNGAHQLGEGNSTLTLTGTIYMTNTAAIMNDPSHYQAVLLNGNPGSSTHVKGDIIVGTLTIKGRVSVTMNLVPYGFLNVRQVALVR